MEEDKEKGIEVEVEEERYGYGFRLHRFQREAIEAVRGGQDVLICSPTGSGKSLPAEYAMQYVCGQDASWVVYYTTPIKALSNEKYHRFRKEFGDRYSVGLLTGDIKSQPSAQMVVMTTEILLQQLQSEEGVGEEVRCVVFDEIHMINDVHRGHVWETCLMRLPSRVQVLGLSATLDQPERFARWMEQRVAPGKQVVLVEQKERLVPLRHYVYWTTPLGSKWLKGKETRGRAEASGLGRLRQVQGPGQGFQETVWREVQGWVEALEAREIRVSRSFVLSRVANHLWEEGMLPAMCYVFSKRQVEECADELMSQSFARESSVVVERACEEVMRRLPNYREYLSLPEYGRLVGWLSRGIAIHHAGMLPCLRELVEVMFAQGFVQWLFCTETMSVGINLPVKTTVFTNVSKFDGERHRPLESFEYTQAAGRAGRLGLDSVGHVVLLANLLRPRVSVVGVRQMLSGQPPKVQSRMQWSEVRLALSLLQSYGNEAEARACVERSMWMRELSEEVAQAERAWREAQAEEERLRSVLQQSAQVPLDVLSVWRERLNSNSWRARVEELHGAEVVRRDVGLYERYVRQREVVVPEAARVHARAVTFQREWWSQRMAELRERGLLQAAPSCALTKYGRLCLLFHESDGLVWADWVQRRCVPRGDVEGLVGFLAAFVFEQGDDGEGEGEGEEDGPEEALYREFRSRSRETCSGSQWRASAIAWCRVSTEAECRAWLSEHSVYLSLGECCRAWLQLVKLVEELSAAAERVEDIEWLHLLSQVPARVLKFVITNQSLYV